MKAETVTLPVCWFLTEAGYKPFVKHEGKWIERPIPSAECVRYGESVSFKSEGDMYEHVAGLRSKAIEGH